MTFFRKLTYVTLIMILALPAVAQNLQGEWWILVTGAEIATGKKSKIYQGKLIIQGKKLHMENYADGVLQSGTAPVEPNIINIKKTKGTWKILVKAPDNKYGVIYLNNSAEYATYFIQKSPDLATAEASPDIPALLLHLYTKKQVETFKKSPSAETMSQAEFTRYLRVMKQKKNKFMGEWARKNKLGFAGILAYLDANFHHIALSEYNPISFIHEEAIFKKLIDKYKGNKEVDDLLQELRLN